MQIKWLTDTSEMNGRRRLESLKRAANDRLRPSRADRDHITTSIRAGSRPAVRGQAIGRAVAAPKLACSTKTDLAVKPSFSQLRAMRKRNVALYSLTILALAACHRKEFQTLPDGVNAVSVNLGSGKWMATVRNEHGDASDTMFAANGRQRSNIYLTPTHQLVIIEQGGDNVFFAIPEDGAPEALTGKKYGERDTRSDNWRYVGVIRGGAIIPPTQAPECIALLGEGRSSYRKQYQVPDFCS